MHPPDYGMETRKLTFNSLCLHFSFPEMKDITSVLSRVFVILHPEQTLECP